MSVESTLTLMIVGFVAGYLCSVATRERPVSPKGATVEIMNHGITERRVHVPDGQTFVIILNDDDDSEAWKWN